MREVGFTDRCLADPADHAMPRSGCASTVQQKESP
jgi:hypothetical protein